jgi:hypothetical protein
MLLDRCPKCGAAVAMHRLDMSGLEVASVISLCYSCRFDLRAADTYEPVFYGVDAPSLLRSAMHCVEGRGCGEWDLGRFEVMHQLCRIMTTRYAHADLRNFVLNQISVTDIALSSGRISFEMRSINERHHLIQLVAWLLVDPEVRLTAAWRRGAVRYNLFLKDFDNPPNWYVQIVSKFSDWRGRL